MVFKAEIVCVLNIYSISFTSASGGAEQISVAENIPLLSEASGTACGSYFHILEVLQKTDMDKTLTD